MNNQKTRFQVIEENFGAYSSFKLTDSQTGEYASVLPFLGGTINNITLRHNNNLIEILDGYISDTNAKETLNSSFKGSNLFPFPNRIKGGKYEFHGVNYQLPVNFPDENNAIHGLIFESEFDILKCSDGDDECVLVIIYKPERKPDGYPFDYILEVEYKWQKENLFQCTSKVTNKSNVDIPVGIGWHPYFHAATGKVDDLLLQFPAEEVLEVNDKMIPTQKTKSFSSFNKLKPIANTQLDHCFVLKTDSNPAEIIIKNDKLDFGYTIWQETGVNKYNFLQIYTPPTRKSIAIEPMTCIPDSFNNKTGLIVLAPGASSSTSWGIKKLEKIPK